MKAGNLILTHSPPTPMLAIRLPSPPFYLCIRSPSCSSSSISSPSAPEGGVRIGNAKRLPPSPSSAKKRARPAGSPEASERSQSSKRERCRTSVTAVPREDGVRSSLDQRSSKIGHGLLASRDACARATRTPHYFKPLSPQTRDSPRRRRQGVRTDGAALDPRSVEDVGGRLFGGRPRRGPAVPR